MIFAALAKHECGGWTNSKYVHAQQLVLFNNNLESHLGKLPRSQSKDLNIEVVKALKHLFKHNFGLAYFIIARWTSYGSGLLRTALWHSQDSGTSSKASKALGYTKSYTRRAIYQLCRCGGWNEFLCARESSMSVREIWFQTISADLYKPLERRLESRNINICFPHSMREPKPYLHAIWRWIWTPSIDLRSHADTAQHQTPYCGKIWPECWCTKALLQKGTRMLIDHGCLFSKFPSGNPTLERYTTISVVIPRIIFQCMMFFIRLV